MGIVMNKYQTPLSDDFMMSLNEEVRDWLLESLNIQFIKNLVSPDREFAKDRPRDKNGRIIVDLCNPHILTDMDYFQPTANYYREHGVLTGLRPNSNRNSEYGKWLAEEVNRCWYGYVRPKDGEWVSGDMYFYLNYSPIIQNIMDEETGVFDRIMDFPKMWELIYLRSHYHYQARFGGIYNDFKKGQHAFEIAKRGASKSYYMASILAKLIMLGENRKAYKNTRGVIYATDKEKLVKDGTLNKFLDILDFCAENTQFPTQRVVDSLDKMTWEMGYKDLDTMSNKGTGNTTLGVVVGDKSGKGRGKRADRQIYEEIGEFPNLLDVYTTNRRSVEEGGHSFGQSIGVGCVCAGTKVYTSLGNLVNIENLKKEDGIIGYDDSCKKISVEPIMWMKPPAMKECVRIEFLSGRILECSTDHPLLVTTQNMARRVGPRKLNQRVHINKFVPAAQLSEKYFAILPNSIPITSERVLENARFIGWMIGDGSYGINKTPVLSNSDMEILEYVHTHFDTATEKERVTKEGKIYQEVRIKGITAMLRAVGIYGQTRHCKTLPADIHTYSEHSICELLGGIFDTDGCIHANEEVVSLAQCQKPLLLEVQLLLQRLGIRSRIYYTKPQEKNPKSKNGWYTLIIKDIYSVRKFHEKIPMFLTYKMKRAEHHLKLIEGKKSKIKTDEFRDRITSVTPIGMQYVYNLNAGNTHTYLANGIVTHNTGGSKEANFSGCMEIIFNPAGYNIYGLPNVFDKSGGSKKCILFMGAYMNRAGCYNKDGVSDVSKALLEILEERRVIKYNSSRSSTLDQAIAEDPITIQEAILKKTTSGYPVAALAEQLQKIDTTAGYLDSIYVGDLVQDETGQPKLVTGPEYVPLRTFPHKDNRQPGAIEFHAFPVKGADGKVMSNRYIAGGDTFDDDSSDTLSLGSIYVLDLFTDEIVCEYTGREDFADQFYEKCRLICLYYNARLNYENNKKGLYTYFSKMHCIYLLTEVLDYLKSKEPAKDLHGNKSRGTQSTEPVKSYGRDRIKTWLCAPVPSPDSTDENPISRPRLYTLRSRALIQELIQWDPNGNYDRHDALLMLMLLREEMLRLSKGDVKGRFREKDPLDRSGDKFFSRYDKIVEARKKHQKHIL